MKARPILFSAPMVRAILEGRKTQTRRICTHRHGIDFLGSGGDTGPDWNDPAEWGFGFDGPSHHGWAVLARGFHEHHNNGRMSIPCPYGVVGDRLWVRESATVLDVYDSPHGRRVGIRYGADGARAVVALPERLKAVKVEQKMPNGVHREGARITIEVTGIRVERLIAISEDDARAEGLTPITKDGGQTIKYGIPDRDGLPGTDDDGWPWSDWNRDPRVAFRTLWERRNGAGRRRGCGWLSSLWPRCADEVARTLPKTRTEVPGAVLAL